MISRKLSAKHRNHRVGVFWFFSFFHHSDNEQEYINGRKNTKDFRFDVNSNKKSKIKIYYSKCLLVLQRKSSYNKNVKFDTFKVVLEIFQKKLVQGAIFEGL